MVAASQLRSGVVFDEVDPRRASGHGEAARGVRWLRVRRRRGHERLGHEENEGGKRGRRNGYLGFGRGGSGDALIHPLDRGMNDSGGIGGHGGVDGRHAIPWCTEEKDERGWVGPCTVGLRPRPTVRAFICL